jgi:hypothetical protein
MYIIKPCGKTDLHMCCLLFSLNFTLNNCMKIIFIGTFHPENTIFTGMQDEFFPLNLVLRYVRS